MSTTIKAIETRYAGCRFRSRLEARWAVFFDQLGIEWEHEPEGFETSAGRYLPDFRIRLFDYPCWFEVKPPGAPRDDRHRVLCVETATPTIVARGMPRNYLDQARREHSWLTAMLWGDRLDGAQIPARGTEPETSLCLFVGPRGRGRRDANAAPWCSIRKARHWCMEEIDDLHVALECANSGLPPIASAEIDDAYAAARSARFGT